MKINTITLQNIHSLKGQHKVDFTTSPLAETGLFAITGPTGSGKSTLLDAITLALFNQTPRTGSLSKNYIEKFGSLITRNTHDAFAEVEYEVGGKVYRSKWEISRARTGNLRDYEMSVAEKKGDGKFEFLDLKKGDVPAKNAEIIALNYDQFVKSILLSQGEFARFLKSDAKERSELLEKITGTEIYRKLGMLAFEKQREEKGKLDRIREKQGDIRILPEEELNLINQRFSDFKVEVEKTTLLKEKTASAILLKTEIQRLKNDFLNLQQQAEKIRLDKLQLAGDERRFALHKKVLPLKSDIDAFNRLIMSIKILENRLAGNWEEHEKALRRAEELNKLLIPARENRVGLNVLLEEKLPLFEKVRNLDQEISLEKAKEKDLARQMIESEKNIQSNLKEKEQANFELLTVKGKLGKIKTFFGQNPLLENLQDVLPGLTEKHASWQKEMIQFERALKAELPDLYQQMQKIAGLSAKIEFLEKYCQQVSDKKMELATNIPRGMEQQETVLNERDLAEQQLKMVDEMIRFSETYQTLSKEKLETDIQISGQQLLLEKLETEIGELNKTLEVLEIHIAELQLRKERETLEASYDEARKKLEPGKPCPLCGSLSHPFVESYSGRLSQTEQLLNEKQRHEKDLKKTRDRMIQEKTRTSANLEAALVSLTKTEQSIFDAVSGFNQLNNQVVENQKIEDTIGLKSKQSNLKNRAEEFKNILRHLQQFKDLDATVKTISRFVEKAGELKIAEEVLIHDFQPFYSYFLPGFSFEQSLEALKKQLNFYKQALIQNQENNEKLASLNASIAEKENQSARLNQQFSEIKANHEKQQKLLIEKSDHRKLLFGNADPEVERQDLERKIKLTEQQIHELEQNMAATQSDAKNKLEIVENLRKEISETNLESETLKVKLGKTMLALGFDSIQQAQDAILSPENADKTEKAMAAINEAGQRNAQSVADTTNTLIRLEKKDDPATDIETLKIQKDEFEKQVTNINQEIGSMKTTIENDAANRLKFQEVALELKAQEAEFNRWNALNGHIGSAEGDKFAKFAQELTMRFMLSKANFHLAKLSNRYQLLYEKNKTVDDLFVSDIYHGGEKRSVKTLSGGESFLVSLALALGLSDLAGSKTRISSLFIDEGFGSLDQETLDIALTTLEKLQHETNRTIGIISHVDALKERITTQIELIRDSVGNSRIEVKVG